MSLAFLAKKSWHTTNISNQEKVWLKQQEQEREKKKLELLQKQMKEEREIEEMRQASGQARPKVACVCALILPDFACQDVIIDNAGSLGAGGESFFFLTLLHAAGKVDMDVLATNQPQHRRRVPHG